MNVDTAKLGIVEAPPWAPGPGEVLVRIAGCLSLGPADEENYVRQPRNLTRLISYACADGPFQTFRKVRSRRLEEAIRGSRELVLVVGTVETGYGRGEPVLAIGTRHYRWCPIAPFVRSLVFRIPPPPDPLSLLALARLAGLELGEPIADARERTFAGLRTWLSPLLGYDPSSGVAVQVPAALSDAGICRAAKDLRDEGVAMPAGWLTQAPTGVESAGSWNEAESNDGTQAGVALIGAGNYARTQILHHLVRSGLKPTWIVDRDPVCASVVAKGARAASCSTDSTAALRSPDVTLVAIATFHDTHAPLAIEAISHGKAVFVEKPAATTRAQLEALYRACASPGARWRVGFNRRYAPLVHHAARAVAQEYGPVTFSCVVREATIPKGHWYYWPSQGTRITGNICHWIDLGYFFCGQSTPVSLTLAAPVVEGRRDEEISLSIVYQNGSICHIVGTGHGDGHLGVEETLDIRRGRTTFLIHDFRRAEWRTEGRRLRRWRSFRDRGHKAMLRSTALWARGRKSQEPLSYSLRDLWVPGLLTIYASEMAVSGENVRSFDETDFWVPAQAWSQAKGEVERS